MYSHLKEIMEIYTMMLLNKMALNLLKKETSAKVGIKNKRLMAGWDEGYLSKIIMGLKN